MFWMRNKENSFPICTLIWRPGDQLSLYSKPQNIAMGAQWLSGRVLDLRLRGCVSSLIGVAVLCPSARHIYPSLVLVQSRKTHPCLTERLLIVHKESNQTKQTNQESIKGNVNNCFFLGSNVMEDRNNVFVSPI